MNSATTRAYFGEVLLRVAGQAFCAAGYALEENPLQQAGGLFRFRADLADGLAGFIEFQVLAYVQTDYTPPQPSRFRIALTRTDQLSPAVPSAHPRFARRDLAALVVEDFGIAVLPSADYWWTFRDSAELGRALNEAGQLTIGFGIPWLAGELTLPQHDV
ncbi:MAG: hypothetical protein JNL34_04490 [Anaerolineae bacterium]|nr:hypothetical protein [Anaerolineae bacterium]